MEFATQKGPAHRRRRRRGQDPGVLRPADSDGRWIWRAGPRSTPVDLVDEPGDFFVSSTEWRFDAEFEGRGLVRHAGYPAGRALAASGRGPTNAPFSATGSSPLGSLLGTAMDAAKAQAPLVPDELGEAVLRNLCGLVALSCGASDEGDERGRDRCGRHSSQRSSATSICISPIPD